MTHAMKPDLQALLRRPDLTAIGVVLVDTEQRTITMWCEPTVSPGLVFANAKEQGQNPAALLFVYPGEVVVLVREEWQRQTWLTDYVASVAHGIKTHRGLEGFLATVPDDVVVSSAEVH